MKSILFVITIGSACALAACSSSKKPASAVPVVAAPAVSAPESVAGKSMVFSFKNAKWRHGEYGENGIEWFEWQDAASSQTETISFKNGKYKYRKTGASTAVILKGDETDYSLIFTSATTGTASVSSTGGQNIDETGFIDFILK